jgi:hypothetical protein
VKNLQSLKFDRAKCRTEWNQFSSLLSSKAELSERNDVLPFFKNRHHLSTLIGSYFPKMAKADCFAHEFEIYGDFIADLIVGDSTEQRYVLVEFEDGTARATTTFYHLRTSCSTNCESTTAPPAASAP